MKPPVPVHEAVFRFYGSLKEMVHGTGPSSGETRYLFHGNPSVKDALEAQGAVHVEVELILINGEPADFSRKLHNGDRVALYPFFHTLIIPSDLSLRFPSRCLPLHRFILDVHLGRLARYLRLLGFDTLYRNDYDDGEIVRLARVEERIVLTCDRGLLRHGELRRGRFIRNRDSVEQLREVVDYFSLEREVRPLSRCVHCNCILEEAEKATIQSRLDERTALYYNAFLVCPLCQRIYWRGSHLDRLPSYVKSLMGDGNRNPVDSASLRD